MREIEFRARNANVPVCWIYGYFVIEEGCHYIVNQDGKFQVIANTANQHIGQKDKHGKKIFEGDILAISSKNRFVVEFKQGAFCKHPIGRDYDSETDYGMPGNLNSPGNPWQIIGNIFENPKMQKEK